MELKDVTHVENIRFGDENSVVIIDQTKLPNETVYLTLTKPEEMYNAIYLLQVRGAPAIGIFAAYSLSVLANGIQADNFDDFYAQLRKLGEYLDSSRPTAVNLHRMVTRMLDKALACKDQPLDQLRPDFAPGGRGHPGGGHRDVPPDLGVWPEPAQGRRRGDHPLQRRALWPPAATAPARVPSIWPRRRA